MTLNAGESAVFARKAPDDDNDSDDVLAVADDPAVERFDVHYSCLRCGTVTSGTEISRLPEIKCICGFKVFTKVRPLVVKSIRAI
ncbi:MAG: RNA polymerase Rbp10 [Thaumarchaeota archaeon]|nr:RNA polymerase Rbp10 [Nitrososphaerota archaeon]